MTAITSEISEFVEDLVGRIPPFPNPFRKPFAAVAWTVRTAFGIVTLILLLAVVAAVPLLNVLALGYLLDVEGRVARSGKLRSAFPLLDLAPKIGSIALGIWLWIIPIRLLAGAAADARLIDPQSASAANLEGITFLAACLVTVHLCLALGRGGGFWYFCRPIKNVKWLIRQFREGHDWEQSERQVRSFVAGLRLKHHFWLGLRGFLGAAVWLFLPTALLAAAEKTEGGPILVTVLGGLCLVPVLAWLPFLQARFAAQNRLRAMFELGSIRQLFAKAPIAWLLAVIVVYTLTLPLYLLKVALPPQDAMWFVTIVFLVSIYPAKVAVGWAYHRAVTKEKRAWFGLRWISRALMVPLLGLYVFLLFFTQFIGAQGKLVLFQHHAFLLPVPF